MSQDEERRLWGGNPSSSHSGAWEAVVSPRSPGRKRFYCNLISTGRLWWQQVTENSSPFILKSGGMLPSVHKSGGTGTPGTPCKWRLCRVPYAYYCGSTCNSTSVSVDRPHTSAIHGYRRHWTTQDAIARPASVPVQLWRIEHVTSKHLHLHRAMTCLPQMCFIAVAPYWQCSANTSTSVLYSLISLCKLKFHWDDKKLS